MPRPAHEFCIIIITLAVPCSMWDLGFPRVWSPDHRTSREAPCPHVLGRSLLPKPRLQPRPTPCLEGTRQRNLGASASARAVLEEVLLSG